MSSQEESQKQPQQQQPDSKSQYFTRSEQQHERCLEYAKDILENVNTVSYIVDTIKKLGRNFSFENIRCLQSIDTETSSPSSSSSSKNKNNTDNNNNNNYSTAMMTNQNYMPPARQAGYMWADTRFAKKGDIVLLEDVVGGDKEDVERALRHELIHAFDDARGEIEPTNCYHQACSEVRAARLSGDCFISEEIKRGRVGSISGRDCVMRRATLAVEGNPLCRGFGSRAVENVMPRCYLDFEPFVAPPYVMGNAEGSSF